MTFIEVIEDMNKGNRVFREALEFKLEEPFGIFKTNFKIQVIGGLHVNLGSTLERESKSKIKSEIK